jgi:PIN domain nuclease of toxin-antitoxin system
MNIIIDTHIFLWLASDPSRISDQQMNYLKNRENRVFLSAMSVAELMIKHSLEKITINFDIVEVAKAMDIAILDFNGNDALALGTLPFHHKDPFDRMIIAQALTNDFSVVTVDHKFRYYDCTLL